jgi:hypothetical protein
MKVAFSRYESGLHSVTDFIEVLRISQKLLPFSLFLLKHRYTGHFKTGVVAPTTPLLAPFIYRALSHMTGERE